MALQCQMVLNGTSYTAGQSPPPQAALQVYNPNAVPVNVVGARLVVRSAVGQPNRLPFSTVEVPTGPGQTTLVPAGGMITIGPMRVIVASAANANPFQAVNQAGNLNPINPQPSQPPQAQFLVNAVVFGSDGSVNFSGDAPMLLSYSSAPPPGYQGGFLNLAGPNNLATAFFAGIF